MNPPARLLPLVFAVLLFATSASVAGDWPGTPSASPIATADGRIYFASPGRSYVIKAGPKFEILATNDLEQEGGSQDYTTAAISDARIYIKGRYYLWCIGKK